MNSLTSGRKINESTHKSQDGESFKFSVVAVSKLKSLPSKVKVIKMLREKKSKLLVSMNSDCRHFVVSEHFEFHGRDDANY